MFKLYLIEIWDLECVLDHVTGVQIKNKNAFILCLLDDGQVHKKYLS